MSPNGPLEGLFFISYVKTLSRHLWSFSDTMLRGTSMFFVQQYPRKYFFVTDLGKSESYDFNVSRWQGRFVGRGMIQLHVNHMVCAIVCPKQVSMRIYYVWLCVQGGYGYVSSVGMYCKFQGTYLGQVFSRQRTKTSTRAYFVLP